MAMPARPLLVLAALLLAALLLSAASAADSKSNAPVTFTFTLPVPASCRVLHSFCLLFLRAPNLSGTSVHDCRAWGLDLGVSDAYLGLGSRKPVWVAGGFYVRGWGSGNWVAGLLL